MTAVRPPNPTSAQKIGVHGGSQNIITQPTESLEGENPKVPQPPVSSPNSDSIQLRLNQLIARNSEPTAMISNHSVSSRTSKEESEAISEPSPSTHIALNRPQLRVPEKLDGNVSSEPEPSTSQRNLSDHSFLDSRQFTDTSKSTNPSPPERVDGISQESNTSASQSPTDVSSPLNSSSAEKPSGSESMVTQPTENSQGSHLRHFSSGSMTQTSQPATMISQVPKDQEEHQFPATNHSVPFGILNEESETTETPSSTHLVPTPQRLSAPGDQADPGRPSILMDSSNLDAFSTPGPSSPAATLSGHPFTDSGQRTATVWKINKPPGSNRFFKRFSGIAKSGTISAPELPTNWESVKTKVSTWISKKIEVESLDSKDIIIAIMGPTGTGKSSFINMVVTAGEEDREASVTVGHNLESCTSEVTMVELRDPALDSRMVLVDTPGFDDTHKSDTEILIMIADWLERTYKNKIQLAGIIYLHRISDNRMAGTPLKNLEMFTKLCGKHALKNVVLATTMWDEAEEEQGRQREIELQKNYWRGMLSSGSKMFRYERTAESAWAIMQHFLDPYTLYGFQLHQAVTALRRFPVHLQHELVDHSTPLPETKAGQTLFSNLETMIAKQQQTLKMLQKERKQNTEEELLRILKDEFESQRKELGKLLAEAERMKVPFMRRTFRLLFSTWHTLPIHGLFRVDTSALAVADRDHDSLAATSRPVQSVAHRSENSHD